MRCSITGMTTRESQPFSSVVLRHSSGSNLRRSTTFDSSSIASAMWAKPQVWNSGAAMWQVQPRRSGIRESSETAASTPALLRGAPFGVPVVPEVRMISRLSFSGCGRSRVLVALLDQLLDRVAVAQVVARRSRPPRA